MRRTTSVLLLVCLCLLRARAQSTAHTHAIENVAAFARLYGVVRFFYPSDAAANVDWDRFAIDGVARVRTASDKSALASRLRELVAALGPGIEIDSTLSPLHMPATSTEPLVAWRYFGPGATDLTARSLYAAKRTNRTHDELFPEAPPAVSDHVDVDLGAGLKARVALTLTGSQAQAKAAPTPAGQAVTPSDLDRSLADIVVAWNVYRHFYPYFTEAAVNWDERLQPQLAAAYEATTRSTETVALRRLVADARDGHGRVTDLRQQATRTVLPLLFTLIDSRVVVMASHSPDVPVGSIVSSIDGVSATERFATAAQLASGTTQWRQTRAAQELASCTSDKTTVRLAIERDASTHTVDVPCVDGPTPIETRPSPVTELKPGIWYVDLTRARKADLTTAIATLATASAVVFDLRGYPTDAGGWLLPYLIDAPEHDRWMHVAKISGPFGQAAGWQSMGWDLQPIEPRLKGRIIFITDGRAISYAESVMGYIADRHLATIVGSPTAGANGNVATFTVPGGFRISFTGMRVTGHDGHTTHHLVGIKPDIVISPTILGLRAGKDEVLERALSLIR